MLLSVRHTTRYSYDTARSLTVQRLRLTPRDTNAQKVSGWTIEADGIENAVRYVDGLGNHVHLLARATSSETLAIVATGVVDTLDTAGVVGDLGDIADPRIFLRPTPLTESSAGIDALADRIDAADALKRLHLLLERIASRVVFQTNATHSGTTAAEAFSAGQGVCQDHAHIFIAAARRFAMPARYVTGYLHLEGDVSAVAHHAWAEAWLPDLGWVGFDVANHICPTERYIRLACGFDAVSAAPITGTRRGGGAESLDVDVVVRQQQQ